MGLPIIISDKSSSLILKKLQTFTFEWGSMKKVLGAKLWPLEGIGFAKDVH